MLSWLVGVGACMWVAAFRAGICSFCWHDSAMCCRHIACLLLYFIPEMHVLIQIQYRIAHIGCGAIHWAGVFVG